jgi:hypothetical protein
MPTLVDALSTERFGTYLTWADGDDALAIRLYSFNVSLSAALYGPLHMLEITLRNIADRALTTAFGMDWMDDRAALVTNYQQRCVADAYNDLMREGKAATHAQMVAELNFGFWSSLFGRTPGNHLWRVLRPIFQTKGLQRSDIAAQLKDFRLLRNRVAHYEPIIALLLAQRYADITTLTGWLSPSAAAWINHTSTWGTIYPAVPVLTVDPVTGTTRFAAAALPFLPA